MEAVGRALGFGSDYRYSVRLTGKRGWDGEIGSNPSYRPIKSVSGSVSVTTRGSS
jgi:hypothetical protein